MIFLFSNITHISAKRLHKSTVQNTLCVRVYNVRYAICMHNNRFAPMDERYALLMLNEQICELSGECACFLVLSFM